MNRDFLARVERALAGQRLLVGGEKVLIGLSGGADSVAMTLALKALASRWSITLHAFHLNHQLRGREADRDERFVKAFCREQGIPCTTARADVRGYSREHKVSIEEAGRNLRYELLEEAADNLGCQKIAVAHNADDNAETVLMNLIRGTGLNGLSGMPVVRGRLIRPLLSIERKEIERFLKQERTPWQQDSSNQHLEFRRNLVRHKLMPILRKINPQVTPTLNRTVRLVKDDDSCLDELARKLIKSVARPESEGYRIDFAELLKYNISLRRRIVKLLMPELDFDTIESVMDVAAGPTGRSLSLTRGRIARREHDGLFVGSSPAKAAAGDGHWAVDVPGRTSIPELGLEIVTELGNGNHRPSGSGRSGVRELRSSETLKLLNSPTLELFDCAGLKFPLSVRPRHPGDRMVPFGGRERKLKEILIDDKIPRRSREALPLLCDQEGILWVIGSRRSNRAPINDDTKKVLTVRVTKL